MFECKKCGCKQYKLEEKGTATALRCANPSCNFWHKWLGKEELAKYKSLLTEKELTTAEKLLRLVELGAVITRAGTEKQKVITLNKITAFYNDDIPDSRICAINNAYGLAIAEKAKENK